MTNQLSECAYCQEALDQKNLNAEMLCESCAKYYCHTCNYSPCACNELADVRGDN